MRTTEQQIAELRQTIEWAKADLAPRLKHGTNNVQGLRDRERSLADLEAELARLEGQRQREAA